MFDTAEVLWLCGDKTRNTACQGSYNIKYENEGLSQKNVKFSNSESMIMPQNTANLRKASSNWELTTSTDKQELYCFTLTAKIAIITRELERGLRTEWWRSLSNWRAREKARERKIAISEFTERVNGMDNTKSFKCCNESLSSWCKPGNYPRNDTYCLKRSEVLR